MDVEDEDEDDMYDDEVNEDSSWRVRRGALFLI